MPPPQQKRLTACLYHSMESAHENVTEIHRPLALQGYSRVVLVGHSYGCYLVNRLASSKGPRERVAAVILIGAGYPVAGYNHLRWIFYLPTIVSSLCCSNFPHDG